MLVPDIFQSKAKPIRSGMRLKEKRDDEVYILNLHGNAYLDDHLSNSVNWTMFAHISIKKKDIQRLSLILQEYTKSSKEKDRHEK